MNSSEANKFNQLCHKLKILDDKLKNKLKNNNKSSCNLKYVGNEQLEKGEIVKILADNQNNQAVVQKMNENPEFLSAIQAGGSFYDQGKSIAVDSEGNSYVTGYFAVEATFGSLPPLNSSGIRDIFVAKLNNTGDWLWAIQTGGIFNDQGLGISVDCQGNSYVTGYFSGEATFGNESSENITLTSNNSTQDIFVAKVNNKGDWLWAIQAGGASIDTGLGISVDCQGNSYVTGYFNSEATFGNLSSLNSSGGNDIFVAKVSNTGTWEWAIQSGGIFNDQGLEISVDCQGNSYVTGYFTDEATFGNNITLNSSGDNDIFVAKVNNKGDWLWAIQAGGTSSVIGFGISVDCQGNSYITGSFAGEATFGNITLNATNDTNEDIFVAKVSNTGEWLWAIQAGGTYFEEGLGISVDCQGNSYVTGYFFGPATFGNITLNATNDTNEDIFVAKVNNTGDWLWAIQAGGTSFEGGVGISVDCQGNCYVTGFFADIATFEDLPPLNSSGTQDIFVAKISSTNLNVVGINKTDSVGAGEVANVEFSGAVIIEDVSNEDLMPGFNYYVGCDNKLSKCCKCAKRFIGVACDNKKLITGVENGCKC